MTNMDPITESRPTITFLVSSPEASGGIARATAILANLLATTYPVTVIGLRRLPRRSYTLSPDVAVRYVSDLATPGSRWLRRVPALRDGPTRRQGHSALTDLLLPGALRELEPGVVISTRPRLHLAAARYAPAHCRTIGQEHVNSVFRDQRESRRHVARSIEHLDQFVVLTQADADAYRAKFPRAADKVRVIGNPSPWPISTVGAACEKVVVAAGHLGIRKGFDRLVDAYAPIAEARPDWRLDIYGAGPRRAELRDQIQSLGLRGKVLLRGRTTRMDHVLERASIFTLSSRQEGLPMVLIEAMTKGVPVVSFDCPRGPAELVDHGRSGLLVDDGDIQGMTDALLTLIDRPDLRRQMSQAALDRADQYTCESVLGQWTDLIAELTGASAWVSPET